MKIKHNQIDKNWLIDPMRLKENERSELIPMQCWHYKSFWRSQYSYPSFVIDVNLENIP